MQKWIRNFSVRDRVIGGVLTGMEGAVFVGEEGVIRAGMKCTPKVGHVINYPI